MRGALVAEHRLDALEGGALSPAMASPGLGLHDVRGLRGDPRRLTLSVISTRFPENPPSRRRKRGRPAVAEEVGDERTILVGQRRTARLELERHAGRPARRQRQLGLVAAQETHEARNGREHLDLQQPLELIERREVLRARRARCQRRADAEAGVGIAGAQLVGQEGYLGLGPHPDDAEAHGRSNAAAVADDARQLRLEV